MNDDQNVLGRKPNIFVLSILILLALMFVYRNGKVFTITVFWVANYAVLGNVRRLNPSVKIQYFLRMTLYFLPYAIPAILFSPPEFVFGKSSLIFLPFAIAIWIFWILIKRRTVKILLSDVVIAACPKEDRLVIILQIYNAIGSAISEELFFRHYILCSFENAIVAIPISAIYFALSHYLLLWGDGFKKSDFAIQLVFGVISSLLYVFSDSILSPILIHALFNSFEIAKLFKCYIRHYVKKDYYDSLMVDKNLNELSF